MSIFEIIGPSVEDNDKAKEIIERKVIEAAEKLAFTKKIAATKNGVADEPENIIGKLESGGSASLGELLAQDQGPDVAEENESDD